MLCIVRAYRMARFCRYIDKTIVLGIPLSILPRQKIPIGSFPTFWWEEQGFNIAFSCYDHKFSPLCCTDSYFGLFCDYLEKIFMKIFFCKTRLGNQFKGLSNGWPVSMQDIQKITLSPLMRLCLWRAFLEYVWEW